MVAAITVSTITIVAASSLVASAAVVATLFLIGFLTGKELLGAASDTRRKLLGKYLTVGIIPLLIGFAIVVSLKVAEFLA